MMFYRKATVPVHFSDLRLWDPPNSRLATEILLLIFLYIYIFLFIKNSTVDENDKAILGEKVDAI